MKHSIFVKFVAVLLTAVSLVAAAGGVVGIVAMESADLYVDGLDRIQDKEYRSIADNVSESYANFYAAKNLSNLSYAMRESQYPDPKKTRGDAEHWLVEIREGDVLLEGPESTAGFSLVKTDTQAPVYPVVSTLSPEDLLKIKEEDPPGDIPNTSAYENVIPPEGYLYHEDKRELEGVGFVTYHYYYYEAPEYKVSVYMRPEVLENSAVHILTSIYPYRYAFIVILAAGLLAFAAGLVFLAWTAGKSPNGKTSPGGFNRVPVDLYFLAAAGIIYAMTRLLARLIRWIEFEGPHLGNLSLTAAFLVAMVLPGIGAIFAFSAQVKVRGFCWKNSLIGRLWRLLRRGMGGMSRGIRKLLKLLPAVWRGLLIACIAGGLVLTCALLTAWAKLWILFAVAVLAGTVMVCYVGYAFGVLLAGATRMARGDLKTKVSTRFLVGDFAACAEQMNVLADVAMEAAAKQMRSERMRTELITNVSHDFKTHLTSIINYVDLLKRPHTQEAEQQYLEVLGRQSLRMKKLLEDLVEMSKASSGNLTVTMIDIDASEAVNQALGEFSDKLEKAKLQILFQPPEEPIRIQADGRLTWRVLSNLLSNAVKYAMPGTRVYVDVAADEEWVEISVKNISAQPLKVSAEELTERFVRGDESRNTEGSGLGLHIAKNLMELQKGQLQLQVDGDLFKAIVRFPADKERS